MKHVNRRSFLGVGAGSLAITALGGLRSFPTLRAQGRASSDVVVDTATGKLRGVVFNGVRAFKGVPYGRTTAGAGRFMPSVPPDPWTGVRDAIDLGPRAPQPVRLMVPEMGDTLTGSGPMSEDCLRLNVWTPAVGAGRRPVMVWLHGGGFRTGSGGAAMFDGKELARKRPGARALPPVSPCGCEIGGEWSMGGTFLAEEWPEARRVRGADYMPAKREARGVTARFRRLVGQESSVSRGDPETSACNTLRNRGSRALHARYRTISTCTSARNGHARFSAWPFESRPRRHRP